MDSNESSEECLQSTHLLQCFPWIKQLVHEHTIPQLHRLVGLMGQVGELEDESLKQCVYFCFRRLLKKSEKRIDPDHLAMAEQIGKLFQLGESGLGVWSDLLHHRSAVSWESVEAVLVGRGESLWAEFEASLAQYRRLCDMRRCSRAQTLDEDLRQNAASNFRLSLSQYRKLCHQLISHL